MGRKTIRFLLDSHALLWAATDPSRFNSTTLENMRDAEQIFVSAVSAYELTIKMNAGRLSVARRLLADLSGYLRRLRYDHLALTLPHAEAAGRLPLAHRDPFDRLLAAQALVEQVPIISIDDKLDQFGVRRVW